MSTKEEKNVASTRKSHRKLITGYQEGGIPTRKPLSQSIGCNMSGDAVIFKRLLCSHEKEALVVFLPFCAIFALPFLLPHKVIECETFFFACFAIWFAVLLFLILYWLIRFKNAYVIIDPNKDITIKGSFGRVLQWGELESIDCKEIRITKTHYIMGVIPIKDLEEPLIRAMIYFRLKSGREITIYVRMDTYFYKTNMQSLIQMAKRFELWQR